VACERITSISHKRERVCLKRRRQRHRALGANVNNKSHHRNNRVTRAYSTAYRSLALVVVAATSTCAVYLPYTSSLMPANSASSVNTHPPPNNRSLCVHRLILRQAYKLLRRPRRDVATTAKSSSYARKTARRRLRVDSGGGRRDGGNGEKKQTRNGGSGS